MKIHNLLCAIFLASRLLFALSTEEAKILVSQAASFSSDDLTSRAEKPLSLLLLDLNLFAEKQVNPDVIKDFFCFKVSDIDRKEMLTVIRYEQQDRYSFIQPQHITKCEYQISGNTANGNIAFEINDLYRGKVEFTAQRNENKWQIMSFTLRHYGLRVVYQQEKWQMVYLPTRFAIIRFTSKAIYASRWFESQISSERKICDLDNLENSSAWLKNFAQQSTLQEISQMKIVIHASEVLWEKVKSFMAIVARHSIYKLYITHDGKTIVKNYLPFDAGIVSTGHEIQPKIIVMVNHDNFSVGKNSFSGQEKYKSLAAHLDGLLKEYSSSAIAFEIRASDDTPYGNIIGIIDICNNVAQSANKKSVVKFSLASPSSSDISIYEEKMGYLEKEMPHDSKMMDPVIEDPVVKDVEDDLVETDSESRTRDYAMLDVPFDSNFDNEAIGIGGGAGAEGHFGSRFGKKFPSSVSKQRNNGVSNAIDAGLTWLKNHQNQDGSWKAALFSRQCDYNGCDGSGANNVSTRVTALALLCFVNNGNTHSQGAFKQQVRKALHYLKTMQDSDGCFDRNGDEYMYHHAVATLAICKLYKTVSYNPLISNYLKKSIDFIIKAQNPESGWGYTFQSGVSNTVVTSWCAIALIEACDAGFDVPQSFSSGVKKWLSMVTDDELGRTGFLQKGDPGPRLQSAPNFAAVETMTAAAICMRISLGISKNEYSNTKGAALILCSLPQWKKEEQSTIDYNYWFYGTVAMKHMGGNSWREWRDTLQPILLQQQCQEDCEKGSWPAIDAWSTVGGRIQATALNTLSLQMLID